MLKKVSVISEDFSLNADVQGGEVAIISLQSCKGEGEIDVAEIVATHEEVREIINMLEHVTDLLRGINEGRAATRLENFEGGSIARL